jgi:hypothetical protein
LPAARTKTMYLRSWRELHGPGRFGGFR